MVSGVAEGFGFYFSGRLEALSDIRARRARMKQLQSKASDTSCTDSTIANLCTSAQILSRVSVSICYEFRGPAFAAFGRFTASHARRSLRV